MYLLDGPYKDKDPNDMDRWFMDTFDFEVDNGGFMRGSDSLLIVDPNATENCLIAGATLQRAQYMVFPTYAPEMLRLIDSRYVPHRPEEPLLDYFNTCDCILVYDMFDADSLAALDANEIANLASMIKTLALEGVSFIVPIDSTPDEVDAKQVLNLYGDSLGAFIEKHFKLVTREIHGTSDKNASNKNRRNAATRGGSR